MTGGVFTFVPSHFSVSHFCKSFVLDRKHSSIGNVLLFKILKSETMKDGDMNGRDDMQIDEPKALDLNHLRVYYGNYRKYIFCLLPA